MHYSTKQVKDSGIFTIFVGGVGGGGGGVRHNFWEIWRGVRANFRLLRGGVLCNISHFSAPPPDNYCTVPKDTISCFRGCPQLIKGVDCRFRYLKTCLLRGYYTYINICYSPAGRSVLGKTVPDVLDTARGRRPRAVSKTEGTVFPNTDRPSAGE